MGEYVNSQSLKFDKSFVSCGVMEAHHKFYQEELANRIGE
jgi:hypothetical protein